MDETLTVKTSAHPRHRTREGDHRAGCRPAERSALTPEAPWETSKCSISCRICPRCCGAAVSVGAAPIGQFGALGGTKGSLPSDVPVGFAVTTTSRILLRTTLGQGPR